MSYSVKEVFYTLQGEGANTGRAAVFLRFAGCNLWSGREGDRSKGPGGCSQWCDTDFVGTDGEGGGRFATAALLAEHVNARWPVQGDTARKFVVCTGGEPLLQLDEALCEALHQHGFEIAVETNGTQTPPNGIDWLCVSPKRGGTLVVTRGQELKLVYPQEGAAPEMFASLAFEHFYLQPMDGLERARWTREAIGYCMQHPQWRLSLQTHKVLGIP